MVLAVGLDKLCTQQTEVHKAQIEVCKACVELHKAYAELRKAYVERLGGSGTHPGLLGALGAVSALFWPPLEGPWLRFADMLDFIVFSMDFILFDVFL